MKKFIVSQDRIKIVEVRGLIEICRDFENKSNYVIFVDDELVAENYSQEEALNQLSLIAAFLNTKGTLNEGVYYMPVFNTSDSKDNLYRY